MLTLTTAANASDPARRRADHARTGDGAVPGLLHGRHAVRRADRRLARRGSRPAMGPGRRRRWSACSAAGRCSASPRRGPGAGRGASDDAPAHAADPPPGLGRTAEWACAGHRGRRPGRPAAGRLPRPHRRRRAARPARHRHRRGRERRGAAGRVGLPACARCSASRRASTRCARCSSRWTSPSYVVDKWLLSEVVGFRVTRGVLAAADRPPPLDPAALLRAARRVAVLEGLNDFENLGALFRNAAAFGVDAVLLDPQCADPLYRRSVRVSMGHVLQVPFAVLPGPWPDALRRLRAARARAARHDARPRPTMLRCGRGPPRAGRCCSAPRGRD